MLVATDLKCTERRQGIMMMQRYIVLTALLMAAFAGCLDSSEKSDGELGEGASQTQAFSGRVPFGENTVLGSAKATSPAGFADMIYLERNAPEPNIGVTSDGSMFVSAFSDVMRSQDGGNTWEVVQTHQPAALNNDPMLWVDTITDRVYSAPMFPTLLCSSVYWSDDSGDSWTPAQAPACGKGPFDHQKFTTGAPGPDTNPLAGVLHETVAYLCYNGIAVTNCMVSYDGGQTWPVDRPTIANAVGFAADALGLPNVAPELLSPCFSGQNGHPTVGPDGTIAFLRTWSCVEPILTFSTDSGLTWTNVPGPQFPGGPSDFLNTANAHSIDPEVAFTPDGTLYVMFQSWNHHAYVAHTKDLGATWSEPLDITPPGITSTVFAALAAGDDGRVAAAFLGTATHNGSSSVAPADTRWYMQFVHTDNADAEDPAWVSVQASPYAKPVQVGAILQGGGTDNTRNLLDFIDGAVTPAGNFVVSFTIGCSVGNGCSELPPEEQTDAFRASDGAVARLHGWSLYA